MIDVFNTRYSIAHRLLVFFYWFEILQWFSPDSPGFFPPIQPEMPLCSLQPAPSFDIQTFWSRLDIPRRWNIWSASPDWFIIIEWEESAFESVRFSWTFPTFSFSFSTRQDLQEDLLVVTSVGFALFGTSRSKLANTSPLFFPFSFLSSVQWLQLLLFFRFNYALNFFILLVALLLLFILHYSVSFSLAECSNWRAFLIRTGIGAACSKLFVIWLVRVCPIGID